MRREWWRRARIVSAIAAAVAIGACGDDSNNPSQSPLVITKAATKSGDQQTGPIGQPLPSSLRVQVTRDGEPVPDVPVNWGTNSGSISPRQGSTATDGITTGAWTLGDFVGTQTATASVTGATNSPITFTATATDEPGTGEPVIQVLGGGATGANRFEPVDITVTVGGTVTWAWADGASGHNVAPNSGAVPARSGDLQSAPNTYHYTFNTIGDFGYHCEAHGDASGGGMAGVVHVVAAAP
jgi:plastocyanin